MKRIFKCLIFAVLSFFISCNPQQHSPKKTERAFYFWKSNFKLSGFEEKIFDSLKVSTLYMKFFDVDWNEVSKQPNPIAQLIINDTAFLQKINIVPVVFITNECIFKIDSSQSILLAKNISSLVQKMASLNKLKNISEIQIDCDWTASTKEKYFAILKAIKKLNNQWKLSATIRMHQVKFVERSGVPPVDKGLLMCYNMGNLKNPATKNSIIEISELKKYIGNLHKYRLPLDIALPLFDWYVLFRNGIYKGLVHNINDSILKNDVVEKNDNRFSFLKDTVLSGYQFKKNDVLRYENSDYSSIIGAAKEINDKLTETEPRLSLYHLDSITLSKYTVNEIENIYNSIH
ncbi:MAG: hypothetical protein QM737_05485 [Ferruginibacter sp.]